MPTNRVGSANLLKLDYSDGDWVSGSINSSKNNGNIVQQMITVPDVNGAGGFTATQKYYYDGLNRIADSTETISTTQTWRQEFSYDRYGNRNFVTGTGHTTTIPSGCSTAVCNPSVSANNNQFTSGQGWDYDASGNTKTDASNNSFIYDGENMQVKVENVPAQGFSASTVGQYYYDGDGKRVKKVVPSTGETTIFVYDAAGKQIAEYSTIVATVEEAKVSYLTNDHLGSPRINTDRDGRVISRHDYHPFGEEIVTPQRTSNAEYASDSVGKQFTGYERDDESGLDFAEARYYAKNLGRFTTADNFGGKQSNPQSLNLYSYVLNGSTKWVDPSGHFPDDPPLIPCNNCTVDKNNYLYTNGNLWTLWARQNAKGESGPKDRSGGGGGPDDLPDGLIDLFPIVGRTRRMAYNISCHNGGGCNIDRATRDFLLLAVDIYTVWESAITLTEKAFAQEVIEESVETGATAAIKSSAEDVATSEASNVNAGQALNSKLGELESAQSSAAQTRTLPDGRIRYSGPETPARTAGPSRGAAHVTEYNPRTGTVRSWHETRGHSGEIRQVHPKTVNGREIEKAPYYRR